MDTLETYNCSECNGEIFVADIDALTEDSPEIVIWSHVNEGCDDPQLAEVDYIYYECQRQHVGNYGDFAQALSFAKLLGKNDLDANKIAYWVQIIAMYIEPFVNDRVYRDGEMRNLRTSHVGFMNGGSAAPTNEVQDRFDRWCEVVAESGIYFGDDPESVEVAIKVLLDIHPWADGNGRTASILRNWMLGTLDDPSPLPYYYD